MSLVATASSKHLADPLSTIRLLTSGTDLETTIPRTVPPECAADVVSQAMLLRIARKFSASTVVLMATSLDSAREIANLVDKVCDPTSKYLKLSSANFIVPAHREHPCTVIYQGICKDCDKSESLALQAAKVSLLINTTQPVTTQPKTDAVCCTDRQLRAEMSATPVIQALLALVGKLGRRLCRGATTLGIMAAWSFVGVEGWLSIFGNR